MADIAEGKVRVTGDTTDVDQKLDSLGDKLKNLANEALNSGNIMKTAFAAIGVGAAFDVIGKAVGGIKDMGAALFDMASAAEKSGESLRVAAQVAANMGNSFDVSSINAQLKELAASASSGTNSMGAMRDSVARFAAVGADGATSVNLMRDSMQIAAARGLELGQVTEAVARAAQGQTAALGRLGVSINDANGKARSFSDIMKELGTQSMGAVEEKGSGLERAMRDLDMSMATIRSTIGEALIPAFTAMATIMTQAVKMSAPLWTWLAGVIKSATDAIINYLGDLVYWVNVVTGTWQKLPEAVGQASTLAQNFVSAMVKNIGAMLQALGDDIRAWAENIKGVFGNMGNVIGSLAKGDIKGAQDALGEAGKNAGGVVAKGFGLSLKAATGQMGIGGAIGKSMQEAMAKTPVFSGIDAQARAAKAQFEKTLRTGLAAPPLPPPDQSEYDKFDKADKAAKEKAAKKGKAAPKAKKGAAEKAPALPPAEVDSQEFERSIARRRAELEAVVAQATAATNSAKAQVDIATARLDLLRAQRDPGKLLTQADIDAEQSAIQAQIDGRKELETATARQREAELAAQQAELKIQADITAEIRKRQGEVGKLQARDVARINAIKDPQERANERAAAMAGANEKGAAALDKLEKAQRTAADNAEKHRANAEGLARDIESGAVAMANLTKAQRDSLDAFNKQRDAAADMAKDLERTQAATARAQAAAAMSTQQKLAAVYASGPQAAVSAAQAAVDNAGRGLADAIAAVTEAEEDFAQIQQRINDGRIKEVDAQRALLDGQKKLLDAQTGRMQAEGDATVTTKEFGKTLREVASSAENLQIGLTNALNIPGLSSALGENGIATSFDPNQFMVAAFQKSEAYAEIQGTVNEAMEAYASILDMMLPLIKMQLAPLKLMAQGIKAVTGMFGGLFGKTKDNTEATEENTAAKTAEEKAVTTSMVTFTHDIPTLNQMAGNNSMTTLSNAPIKVFGKELGDTITKKVDDSIKSPEVGGGVLGTLGEILQAILAQNLMGGMGGMGGAGGIMGMLGGMMPGMGMLGGMFGGGGGTGGGGGGLLGGLFGGGGGGGIGGLLGGLFGGNKAPAAAAAAPGYTGPAMDAASFGSWGDDVANKVGNAVSSSVGGIFGGGGGGGLLGGLFGGGGSGGLGGMLGGLFGGGGGGGGILGQLAPSIGGMLGGLFGGPGSGGAMSGIMGTIGGLFGPIGGLLGGLVGGLFGPKTDPYKNPDMYDDSYRMMRDTISGQNAGMMDAAMRQLTGGEGMLSYIQDYLAKDSAKQLANYDELLAKYGTEKGGGEAGRGVEYGKNVGDLTVVATGFQARYDELFRMMMGDIEDLQSALDEFDMSEVIGRNIGDIGNELATHLLGNARTELTQQVGERGTPPATLNNTVNLYGDVKTDLDYASLLTEISVAQTRSSRINTSAINRPPL